MPLAKDMKTIDLDIRYICFLFRLGLQMPGLRRGRRGEAEMEVCNVR